MTPSQASPTMLATSWIDPTSTEPTHLVNREEEKKTLGRIVLDYVEGGKRQALILVTGDRGVGKSILTRHVMKAAATVRPDVIPVPVDGRGLGFRRFLKDFARQLVEGLRGRTAPADAMNQWLDQLSLLANNDQISSSQAETLARKYGVDAGVETGLFWKLKAMFSWEESRQLGKTTQQVQTVTDDLLHGALNGTLEKIGTETSWTVLVFFNDLDQALTSGEPQAVEECLRRVLDVKPCLGLVHLRTEMLLANVRRIMDDNIEIKGLQADEMLGILRTRLEKAPDPTRSILSRSESLTPFRQLASVTTNPLVFLRWTVALLRIHPWPLPSEWRSSDSLLKIVKGATTPAVDDEILLRYGRVVDECLVASDVPWFQRADLHRGHLITDPSSTGTGLSEAALKYLESYGLLLPRDRFHPESGYRMEPMLELLRPSIALKLQDLG